MNDEELYQQASDELASERRDLRVWAQACSLAPEDHDEARFLYTNLRVEELLVERREGRRDEARRGAPERTPEDASSPAEPAPETLARGSVPALAAASSLAGKTASAERGDGRRSAADGDDIGALFASLVDDADEERDDDEPGEYGARASIEVEEGHRARASSDRERARDGAVGSGDEVSAAERDGGLAREGDEDGDGDGRAERPSSTSSPSGLDDDFSDLDDLDDLDWPDRRSARPPAARTPANEPDLAPAATVRGRPDTAGLTRADAAAGNEDDTDEALAAELERQARELPIETVPSSAPPTNVPLFERDARIAPKPEEVWTGPLELDAGGRREYALYHRPGSREQAVRQGGSVTALLLTLPWLLYRGLFGTALLYALFCTAVLPGLTITGLAWFDAGAAATTSTRLAFTAFALLALFGTIVAPWWQANRWRQEQLERRGFSLVARVRARNPKAAFAAFERESRGHVGHAAR